MSDQNNKPEEVMVEPLNMKYEIETLGKKRLFFIVSNKKSLNFWVEELKKENEVSVIRITGKNYRRVIAYENDGWVGTI